MNTTEIAQRVEEQLKQRGIEKKYIYVIEKKWGYTVQVGCKNNEIIEMNEIFNREGQVIYPLSGLKGDAGEVYCTEVYEMTYERLGRLHKQVLTRTPSVQYVELDESHFIIPRLGKSGMENVLFFVDENNKARIKGLIKGKIQGDALGKNEQLLERKQVLTTVEIDKTKDRFESFFYSWEENRRVSDKWSYLIPPRDNMAVVILREVMNINSEEGGGIIQNLMDYMEETGEWLAVLRMYSENNKFSISLVTTIGIDGIPTANLKYIAPETHELKIIPLEKEKIGEVERIREELQEKLDKKEEKAKENKENLYNIFFADMITEKKQERLENGKRGVEERTR